MRSLTTIIALLGLQSAVSAHMLMSDPPSLRYKGNKNVPSDKVDSDMTSPLHGDGSNFPCKGYQVDLGTPLGASVADWPAGSSQSFGIEGGAFHNGGSCQAALSYDNAKTFTVIHSYIGNCPTSSGGSFPFTVPADAPAGAALFAWTWFNNVGNREMYMNCASVTIKGSGSKKRADTSFSSRPSIFTANIGSDCHTPDSLDVDFPNPGPDLTNVTHAHGSPTGKQCQAVSGSSPPAGIPAANPSQGASSAMLPSFTSAAQSVNSATIPSYTSAGYSANSATAPSSTPAAQGGSSPGTDGSCGGQTSCIGSVHGSCCSQWGYCGSTPAYCGTGCQSAFGTCGTSNTTGSSSALQVSVDKTCGPSTSNTCQGSSYGNCCSQYGYCGSTSDYCGTGCQSGFGTCGTFPVASSPVASPPAASPPATGSTSTTSSPSTTSQSPANPIQSTPSTFITMTIAKSSASAVTVIPVTGY